MQTVETLVPDIVSNIPMPPQSQRTLPTLDVKNQLRVKATTIKVISDLTGEPIVPTEEEQAQAQAAAHQIVTKPDLNLDLSQYPNATVAYLTGLIAESNHMIVKDLADLKLFVVNRLIKEYDEAEDSKTRITALRAIGEIDGVDAFKRRTETTHIIKPIEEVEKELLSVLEGIEYHVVSDGDGGNNG